MAKPYDQHWDLVRERDALKEELRAAKQAHDELVLRLEEANVIIEEWKPFPTIRVRKLEELLREIVKQTPFTPTEVGLDLHITFELIHRLQVALKEKNGTT